MALFQYPQRFWPGLAGSRGILVAGLASLLLFAAGSPALGQAAPVAAGQLGCAIAAKDAPSAEDEQRIRQFVGEQAALLAGKEPGASVKAREALEAPLKCSQVTVAFRLKYGEALRTALEPLVGGADERVAVNALILLGKSKTSAALPALQTGLTSANAVIRMGATTAHRELLAQVAKDAGGFPDNARDQVLDRLGVALAKEGNAHVAEGLMLALGDATREKAELRARAMLRLADSAQQMLKTVRRGSGMKDPAWSRAMLRGLDAARQTLFAQAAGGLDREFARRAALLGGQVFAFVRDRLDAGVGATDPSLAMLAGAAEGLAIIANSSLGGAKIADRGMQALVTAGNAGGFEQAAEAWIGAGGVLTKAPYNAKAEDFAPGK